MSFTVWIIFACYGTLGIGFVLLDQRLNPEYWLYIRKEGWFEYTATCLYQAVAWLPVLPMWLYEYYKLRRN